MEVVAEAGDGLYGLELIRREQPEVVLMDISMPGLNGLVATERAVKEFPTLRVIILSMYGHEEYVLRALRAGAAGYLLKEAAASELALALDAVLRGETYLAPSISRNVIAHYVAQRNVDKGRAVKLTPRQREILQLIAEGKTTKEIAFVLGLSVKTVETHRSMLMDRLRIRDIPGLVRHAMRIGLIEGEQGMA